MGILKLFLVFSIVLTKTQSFYGFSGPGDSAIPAFFIVSGFYMSLVLRAKYQEPGGIWIFYSNRVLRLFPIYWALLLIFVFVAAIKVNSGPIAQISATVANPLRLATDGTWPSLVSAIPNLLFVGSDVLWNFVVEPQTLSLSPWWAGVSEVSGLRGAYQYLVAPQTWSLGVVVVFYAMAPALARLRLRYLLLVLMAFCVVQIRYYAVAGPTLQWSQLLSPYFACYFVTGMAAHRIWPLMEPFTNRATRFVLALLPFAIALFWQALPMGTRVWPYWVIFALGLPALFNATRNSETDNNLGAFVYPIFLCHILFTWAMLPLGNFSGIAAFTLSFALSWVLIHFVDRPIQALRRRRVSERGVLREVCRRLLAKVPSIRPLVPQVPSFTEAVNVFRDFRQLLRFSAFPILGATLLAFQANILSFFGPSLSRIPGWREIYYISWVVLLVATVSVLIIDRRTLKLTFPLILVSSIVATLSLWHTFDSIAKNLVVGLVLFSCVAVLAIYTGMDKALQYSGAITVVSAALCLVDVMLPGVFANTTGRASGFAENANTAAAQLLIGTLISWRAIPSQWRGGFFFIIVAAIFATLSRSTLVVGGVAFLLSALPYGRSLAALRFRSIRRGLVIPSLVLLSWLAVAMLINPMFGFGSNSIVARIGQVSAAIKTFTNSAIPTTSNPSGTSAMGGVDAELRLLGERALQEGPSDPAAARATFFRRSVVAYQNAPMQGLGLREAYALAPHNSYLLFAVAFGAVGWLVPAAFLVLLAIYSRRDWSLAVTVAALMFFSHDLLLLPAAMSLISVGLAGLIVERERVAVSLMRPMLKCGAGL